MRFVVFKGEKSVADLADRLFVTSGKAKASKQTLAALLQANPQLNNIDKVPAGSLIAVPDSAPPLNPAEKVVVSNASSIAATVVGAALTSLYQSLDQMEAEAGDKIKAGMDDLQSADMKSAIKTVSGQGVSFAGRVPSIDAVVKYARQLTKDLQAAQQSRQRALKQIQAAISSFAGNQSA